MINIVDKSKCCGCTACMSRCPKNAIEMVEDKEGFLYPVVNKEKCINCGLCENVCPYNNKHIRKDVLKESIAYGGWSIDESIRKNSTSGGIFSEIAKYIFDRNGVVCGAVYDDKLNVVHEVVEDMNGLIMIRGSKYVQSSIGENFKKIEKLLKEGRLVLFSGTPCQVSGLNSFLGKDYENLYTCDIVCHGVPSPKIFNKYKKELEKEKESELIEINFRKKVKGWQNYSLFAKFKNDTTYIVDASDTAYMKIFIGNLNLRRTCYTCEFGKLPRQTDFTLGDFWGVDEYYPELNEENKGTSLVLVHTDKGKRLLKEMNGLLLKECQTNKAIKRNPSILVHKIKNKKRKEFFRDIDFLSIDELANKYIAKDNIIKRGKRNIKKIVKRIIN